MKISVLANLYGAKPLDEALKIITGLGGHTVEIAICPSTRVLQKP